MELEMLKPAVDASRSNYQNYLSNVWGMMGFFLLSIGWLLTSREARNFLGAHDKARKIGILVGTVLYVAHVAVLWELCVKSEHLMGMISKIDLVKAGRIGEQYVAVYRIPEFWVIVDAVVSGLLLAILFALFRYVKQVDRSGAV